MDDLLRRRAIMQDDKPVFVDWIKGDGHSYIFVAIMPTIDSEFTIDVRRADSSNPRQAAFGNLYVALLCAGVDRRGRALNYANFGIISKQIPFEVVLFPYTATAHNVLNKDNLVVGTTTVPINATEMPISEIPFLILGRDMGSGPVDLFTGKIYGFSWTGGGNSIVLKPCLYRSEYGLWDTISNKFYGNSGTGTITGGYD